MAKLDVRNLGDYIREQRAAAQISLRQLATLAGVSNPYLSQIERGLRKPSAEILQQIAKALRISAEALYVQAGILEERYGDSDVPAAIMADGHLAERQKQVLLELYEAYRRENDALAGAPDKTTSAAEAAEGTTSRTRTARRAKPATSGNGAASAAGGTADAPNRSRRSDANPDQP
ncbi:MAG TPA: helix-turn-helix transcriptional regulator [Mycobacteriales bacterium]|nr:helix-turn-helix transcriptional regulator [Mycobacteriales bacterium]